MELEHASGALGGDAGLEYPRQALVAGARAHGPAKIEAVAGEEAVEELTVGAQAQAVAIGTERIGDGLDEPESSAAVLELEAARGSGGPRTVDLLEGVRAEMLREILEDGVSAENELFFPLHVLERHQLDEAHRDTERPGVVDERDEVGLAPAPDGDGIEFNLQVRHGHRHLRGRAYLGQAVDASEGAEALGLHRVDREAEVGEAGGHERGEEGPEEQAVGGERDHVDAGDEPQHPDELIEVPSEEWFSAGQADAVDPETGPDPNDARDLLEVKDLVAGEGGRGAVREAIAATHLASVGDRDPERPVRAGEGVDKVVHARMIPQV